MTKHPTTWKQIEPGGVVAFLAKRRRFEEAQKEKEYLAKAKLHIGYARAVAAGLFLVVLVLASLLGIGK